MEAVVLVQADVDEKQVRALLRQKLDRRGDGARGNRLVSRFEQQHGQTSARRLVVVDDQDLWRHPPLSESLLRERDLNATLYEVQRVLQPGGTFGIELVADLPSWKEYKRRLSLKGWRGRQGGAHVTLLETVRQDPARHLTIFDQEFTERRGRTSRVHRFALTFRTLSVPQMVRRLEKSGFEITALLGDYRGKAWDPRADVWVILAKSPSEKRP